MLRWHTRQYLKHKRNQTEKRLIKMVWLKTFCFDIVCLTNLLLFYCLTYKSYKVTFDNFPMPGKIQRFWIVSIRCTRFILKLSLLQLVTSAVYSISMKSIFARAVIGSPGVFTNSIITTVVCCAGILVDIYSNKLNVNEKRFIEWCGYKLFALTCCVSLICYYFIDSRKVM